LGLLIKVNYSEEDPKRT